MWPFCPSFPGTHPMYPILSTPFPGTQSLYSILLDPPLYPQPQAQAGDMNCSKQKLQPFWHPSGGLFLDAVPLCALQLRSGQERGSGYCVCLAPGLSLKLHWCRYFFCCCSHEMVTEELALPLPMERRQQ